MAVQESAAQLSMTLKVQEYPTLKVGAEPPPPLPARRRGVKPLVSRRSSAAGEMRAWRGGRPGPPSFPLPASGAPGPPGAAGRWWGFPPHRCPPVPVFLRLTSRLMPVRLLLFPSPSAEGEGRAWNMLLSSGVSVPGGEGGGPRATPGTEKGSLRAGGVGRGGRGEARSLGQGEAVVVGGDVRGGEGSDGVRLGESV